MTNDWQETLEWYDKHQTTSQIGFNPDGMCLKVCRTARGLGSLHASAVEAQNATPLAHRVHKVRDLRKGMVLYFDTVGDSNPFGHIVTMIGRVPGFDWDDLNDVLVETNSVKSGELVVVRASYFEQFWGDKFQFGATWLNGEPIDTFTNRTKIQRFRRSGPAYNVKLLDRAVTEDRRNDLKKPIAEIEDIVNDLAKDNRRKRIVTFREEFDKKRVINIGILKTVIKEDNDPDRSVHRAIVRLHRLIKALPER